MSSELVSIKFCNLDINNTYEHSIHFDTIEAQRIFFDGRVETTRPSYPFIRRTWELKVDMNFETAQKYNYMFFDRAGKRWYYFINNHEFVNEDTTKLLIELDVIQSYMFDWDIPPCFIERQHVLNDTIGYHTLDEGLECGELVSAYEHYITELNDLCIIIASTAMLPDGDYYAIESLYDGVFSGLMLYVVETTDYNRLGGIIGNLTEAGKIDCIVSMFMYPKKLVNYSDRMNGDKPIYDVLGKKELTVKIDDLSAKVNYWNGYVPKNNKLYCYPYSFYVASNNNGGFAVYKREKFTNSESRGNLENSYGFKPEFKIIGSVLPGAGCKLIPYAYNTRGNAYNDEEGLTMDGFPSCAWNSDTYKIWLAQNENSHKLIEQEAYTKKLYAGVGGALGVIGGIATGNYLGALASGAGSIQAMHNASSQVRSLVAQQEDMSIVPPQARGNLSPALNLANGLQTFSIIFKCIKPEYAKVIDDYFSMYGYKVNRIDTPYTCTRQQYTYIKTQGCMVHGAFNNNDRVLIGKIFDKGITFWRDGLNIGAYGSNPCF